MKTYTGNIEDMGRLVDRQSLDASRNSRGGKLEYIMIGKETFRRIGCPSDLFSFMKIGMEATIYVLSVPIMGKVIVGVNDLGNNRRMMARSGEVLASCVMLWFSLSMLFIIPAFLIGYWQVALIIPIIISIMTYMDYKKAINFK